MRICVYTIIASGAFRPDGSFVPVPLFQENVLRELFEANVFKLLVSQSLITAELIAKIRTWKHSGFHVYVGPASTEKEDAVRVGLYIIRAPASASRLQLAQDGLLMYLAKGSIPNERCDALFEPNGQILDPLEWIAKLTLHIPEQRAQTIRYYGRYSNVSRAKTARRARLTDHTTQDDAAKEDSESEWLKDRKSTWAALIKLIYESDPLLCPKCGTQMKIVAVIKDGALIDKILDHLQYKFDVLLLPARPPPPETPDCNSDFSLDSPVWTQGD